MVVLPLVVSPLARSDLSDEFWKLSLDSLHTTYHARAPPASISSLEAIARGRVRSERGGIFEGESGFKAIKRLYVWLNRTEPHQLFKWNRKTVKPQEPFEI